MEDFKIVAKLAVDGEWTINDQKETFFCNTFEDLHKQIKTFINEAFEELMITQWKEVWNPTLEIAAKNWSTLEKVECTITIEGRADPSASFD